MKNNKILIVVLVVLFGATACVFSPAETAQKSEVVNTPLPVEEVSPVPTETSPSVEEPNTEVTPQSSPTQEIKQKPKDELESTDPDSVSLASGEVQLVEIFAFW